MLSPATLKDFPDRFSPILTKELRQGLRQHGFVLLFIFLQVIMAIVVFAALLGAPVGSRESLEAGKTVSGFFFSVFGIAALVIQPLRGLNALAGEIKGGTIDLLLLTRLNAWRIASGKWFALVSQTALLLIAILPYLIMRYYLGGMQLFSELLILFTMFVLSGSLTAITVGFSATTSTILRGLFIPILGFPLLGMLVGFSSRSLFGGGSSPFDLDFSRPGALAAYLGSLATAAFVGYYFLELGATQIAPPSENRSTRKRLLGLLMLGLINFAFQWEKEAAWAVSLGLCTMLAIDALTENPVFTASVTRPFLRLRFPGRLLGRFLYPGWPAGTLYTGLLALLLAGLAARIDTTTGIGSDSLAKMLGFGFVLLSNILYPAVLIAIFRREERNTFGLYFVVMLGAACIGAIFTILGNALNGEETVASLFFLFPMLGLFGFDEIDGDPGFLVRLSAAVFAAYWLLLFFRGMIFRKRARALELSEAKPAPPPHAS